jgi:hypothetical protein
VGTGGAFATLADAIAGVPNGTAEDPIVITVLSNEDLAAVITIPSGKHIKLVAVTTATLKRLSSVQGILFMVNSGCSLTIGDGIIVDGNKSVVSEAYGSLVRVQGGTFTLEAGATLKDNAFTYGGAVFVSSGSFTMQGGAISGNSSSSSNGGGVSVDNGTFTMQGGTISDNSAGLGGGVYVGNGTFTLEGGTVYGSGAGDDSNTASSGAALFNDGTAQFGAGGGSVGGDPRVGGSAIDTTNETLVGAGA